MERGLFIAFEGPSFSGKTSLSHVQLQRLIDNLPLRSDGEPSAIWFHFPPRTNIAGPGSSKRTAFNSRYFRLPFIQEKASLIIKALERGQHVVVDRYVYTELANLMPKGLNYTDVFPLEWCLEALKGLPKPDVVFHLEVSTEVASKRSKESPTLDDELRRKKLANHEKISSNLRRLQLSPAGTLAWIRLPASLGELAFEKRHKGISTFVNRAIPDVANSPPKLFRTPVAIPT